MRKKEHFLVLELFRHGMRATHIRVDEEGRMLYVAEPIVARAGESLSAFTKRLGDFAHTTLVVSCDAAFATTVHGSVAIDREEGMALDAAAVEHMIAQAIWKLFDGERVIAAKRFGVAPDELMLADVRVWRVTLDGRTMVDCVGYAAKRVEVTLAVTLLPRAQYAALVASFPGRTALMSESGVSWARVLRAMVADRYPFLVAGLFPEHATLTIAHEDIRYLDAFDWGERDFIAGIAGQLAVTEDIARYIIRAVRDGAMTSPLFTKKVGGIIAAELQLLVNGLQTAVAHSMVRAVHVVALYDLPSVLFDALLKNASRKSVRIVPVSADAISKNFGFAIQWKMQERACEAHGTLVAFFDAYLAPNYVELNAIARQRAHWLRNGMS